MKICVPFHDETIKVGCVACVFDMVAKVKITPFTEFDSDVNAMRSFMQFCEKDGVNASEYCLIEYVGNNDDDDIFVCTCTGDSVKEQYENKVKEILKDE